MTTTPVSGSQVAAVPAAAPVAPAAPVSVVTAGITPATTAPTPARGRRKLDAPVEGEAPSNLFKDAQADEDAKEAGRAFDRQVELLITPKGLEKLRAFGFQVIKVADSLPAKTTDRRSL